jgi:hypothetical protein
MGVIAGLQLHPVDLAGSHLLEQPGLQPLRSVPG